MKSFDMTRQAFNWLLMDQYSHLPSEDNAVGIVGLPREIESLSTHDELMTDERVIDRRSLSSKKHDRGKRAWSVVTGICLHQTACILGEKPKRWDTVGCHAGITRSGRIIRIHDLDRIIIHGNGWNGQCVGIEIDGMYEGIKGDRRTFWRDGNDTISQPQSLTIESVNATKQLIRDICNEVASHGGEIVALVAHRQASSSRRSDPGSEIWQKIAVPMSEELSLSDGGNGFRIGSGMPIPEEWDYRRPGIKY